VIVTIQDAARIPDCLPFTKRCDMQEIITTRERLLGKLRVSEQAGDADVAALLEYGIAEFDGVIALLTGMTERGNAVLH
jgi:hypothetical protein